MSQSQNPKPGANITLIDSDGRRVQGQFISVLDADWNVAIKSTDVDWLFTVSHIEINFIMNLEVCTAQAEVRGFDATAGRCLLVNIDGLKSRPLRGQARIGVDFNCAVILKDGANSSTDFINSRQNSVSNISRTGALLSTNRQLDPSRSLLLLFALDGHPDLEPPDHRLFVSGRIVRVVGDGDEYGHYQYGIHFSMLPPDFFEMLSSYIEHQKSLGLGNNQAA